MAELTAQELAATFNATNVTITVEEGEDSKFTYFSPGDETAFTNNLDGKVDIGGTRLPRSYVFTWLTPFGEESIPSKPSETQYCREGEKVIVRNLPTSYTSPDGKPRLVRGIRLYRSVVSPSGSEYFRLATLWFPNTIVRASKDGDIVTAESRYPHALIEDDRILVDEIGISWLQTGAEGVVTEIVDRFTFKYRTETSSTNSEQLVSQGFYYDASEDPTDEEPFYWGKDNGDLAVGEFEDDYDVGSLTTIIPSLNYEPPPEDLQGLVILPTNIMVGFVGSKLYFSEPNQYHAWPSEYVLTLDYRIVGLAVNAGTLVVLTEGYPYRVDGNTPESMLPSKIDSMYPCLSKKSIVSTGSGVFYSTHSGIALYSPARGAENVTKFLFEREDWQDFVDSKESTVVAGEFENKYVAFYGDGGFQNRRDGFTFESDPQLGGQLVRLADMGDVETFWTDPSDGNMYMSDRNYIKQFDPYNKPQPNPNTTAYLEFTWQSKEYELPIPTDFSVMQVDSEEAPIRGELNKDIELNLQKRYRYKRDFENYLFRFPLDIGPGLDRLPADGSTVKIPNGMKFDRFTFTIRSWRPIRHVSFGSTTDSLKEI